MFVLGDSADISEILVFLDPFGECEDSLEDILIFIESVSDNG